MELHIAEIVGGNCISILARRLRHMISTKILGNVSNTSHSSVPKIGCIQISKIHSVINTAYINCVQPR